MKDNNIKNNIKIKNLIITIKNNKCLYFTFINKFLFLELL